MPVLVIALVLICLPGIAAASQILHPQAFNFTGLYSIQSLDPNLTGKNITIGLIARNDNYHALINDYRPAMEHQSLADAAFSLFDDNSVPVSFSPHTTAICSILFGYDPNAWDPNFGTFTYRGAVPDANAAIFEFRHFIQDHVYRNKETPADILSMSLGTQFDDWWTRGIAHLAETQGTIIIAAIGNGSGVADPPLYPAANANVLAVGVMDSVKDQVGNLAAFTLPNILHSSRGPTPDGRCKPDIVAPANCLVAVASTQDTYYSCGDWSSFATPVATGTVAALLQKAHKDPNLALYMEPDVDCVMKAIVMNSARKLPLWHKGLASREDDHSVPLDYKQGAGMIDTITAFKQLTAGHYTAGNVPKTGWDNSLLLTQRDKRVAYFFEAAYESAFFIAATLVWDFHYQKSYPFRLLNEKNADLRLELWALDLNKPSCNRLLDYSDSRVDNVEHIYFPLDPNYIQYALVISSNTDIANNTEQYSLAWNILSDMRNADFTLACDLNSDGIVDSSDMSLMSEHISILSAPMNSDERFDLNLDGHVDPADLKILADNFN